MVNNGGGAIFLCMAMAGKDCEWEPMKKAGLFVCLAKMAGKGCEWEPMKKAGLFSVHGKDGGGGAGMTNR